MKKVGLIALFILSIGFSQIESGFQFIKNQGQWSEPFVYKTKFSNGELFFQKSGLVYSFWNNEQKSKIMDAMHHKKSIDSYEVDAHGVFVDFLGAHENPRMLNHEQFNFYHNYYLGSDSSKWKGKVPIHKDLSYQEVYDGINLSFYTSKDGHLKYDWIVKSYANPNQIRLNYRGANSVALMDNGSLHIVTSVNDWLEEKPYAYQIINGEKKEVDCNYVLKNNVLSFELGDYDESKELIIDPTLIFSTYSGSTQDNWGFTATYSANSEAYGGGIVFANNAYPAFPGSYQLNYAGGDYDALICKYNNTGTTLMYYTYLGGNRADAPMSLVCNSANELFILGVTGSSNFPTTATAFQTTFGGGSSITIFTVGLIGADYPSGSDIFVSKLNPDGTALLASTFVGGSGNDGLNRNSSNLDHNYADEFRGEIIVDLAGNCYFTTSTNSSNFPTVVPFQGALGGAQDAVVCKLNSTLTTMMFGSYLGGSSDDAGYSVQINSASQLYVTGGTNSSNLPMTPGAFRAAYAGSIDGYVYRVSAAGALLNTTYIGTGSYDQCYNVQIDSNDDVYVLGQTTGTYPISGGVYSNPNSGQFIQKLNPSLAVGLLSTVFGRGIPGQIDIVPTAFLVDVCDHIYVAGWGGNVNASSGGGSTSGMPITPANAFQTSTDGSDFYLIVLSDNASSLLYGTYFGGVISAEHVDGGTSRFDKNGIVYEAVCAGCGSNNDFPTSPGAWSNTNNSANCNLGLFVFDISEFSAIIDPQTPTVICSGGSITLNNASTGGFPHEWDFGDGTTSTDLNVTHTYASPGTYTVYLEVFAPNACLTSEKDSIIVVVEAPPVASIAPILPICSGDSVQLIANVVAGVTYSWAPNTNITNNTISNPFVFPTSSQVYTLTMTNNCGSDNENINVNVIVVNADAGPDVDVCNGSTVQLAASGGASYAWTPAIFCDNPNVNNPNVSPTFTTNFIVTVTDVNGCTNKDTLEVEVFNFPIANAGPDITLCEGETAVISGSGGVNYVWSPSSQLNNAMISNPTVTGNISQNIVLAASNICGTDYDTMRVNVIRINANSIPDQIICPYTSIELTASGGTFYLWSPGASLNTTTNDTVIATPIAPTTYIVQVTDTNGCSDYDTIFIDLYPVTDVNLGPNILIPFQGSTTLQGDGIGTYLWTPDTALSCNTCLTTIASPLTSTQYTFTLTDTNGCKFSDSIWVFVEGTLYIPNTFTPNIDEINPVFFAYGTEIKEFELRIFNRWGEEIFLSTDINHGWNGIYKNQQCPQGVYAYRCVYSEMSGKGGTLYGHVNLIR